MVRSKPFSDRDTLHPICDRCANANQVIVAEERCTSCFHQFVRSFISFENLPLVEFKLEKGSFQITNNINKNFIGMTHRKFLELLNSNQDGKAAGGKTGEYYINYLNEY